MDLKGVTSDLDLYKYARTHGIRLNKVVFRDELTRLTPKAGGYIVNSQSSLEGGRHWITLYLCKVNNKNKAFFMDPYGMVPPQEIIEFSRRWGDHNLSLNVEQIQKINSNYCGSYCLLFLYNMEYSGGRYIDRFKAFCDVFDDYDKRIPLKNSSK